MASSCGWHLSRCPAAHSDHKWADSSNLAWLAIGCHFLLRETDLRLGKNDQPLKESNCLADNIGGRTTHMVQRLYYCCVCFAEIYSVRKNHRLHTSKVNCEHATYLKFEDASIRWCIQPSLKSTVYNPGIRHLRRFGLWAHRPQHHAGRWNQFLPVILGQDVLFHGGDIESSSTWTVTASFTTSN